MGRSMLSSVTGALRGRFAEASKSSTVTVAGHRVPVAADAEAVRAHRGGVAADTAAAARPVSVHSAVAGGLPSGRLTGESWLRSSRFMLVVDTPQAGDAVGDRGTRWTVWGSGDWQSFTGEPGNGIGYNGSLRTVHVGADVGGERWLAGAFVSRAAGKSRLSVRDDERRGEPAGDADERAAVFPVGTEPGDGSVADRRRG